VKFFDIKKRFFSGSSSTPEDSRDDEDDSWLDEPNLDVPPPEVSLEISPFVQLSSPCLTAALSEEPPVGISDGISSTAEALDSHTLPDDNFSMEL
jgi:hypothetical protein